MGRVLRVKELILLGNSKDLGVVHEAVGGQRGERG
jgi:hypothetical protein